MNVLFKTVQVNSLPSGIHYVEFRLCQTGRPREFDPDKVLDRAVYAFSAPWFSRDIVE